MPSSFPKRFHKTLGFRLSVWYALIFILSSLILSLVSYLFVFSSLRDNRVAIQRQLAEYKALADVHGVAAVAEAVSRQRKPSRRTTYFIRIVGTDNQTLFLSHPQLWEQFDTADVPHSQFLSQWRYYASKRDGDLIEVTSARLASGDLLQVGKGITDREEVVERFGTTLLATIIPMVFIGLAGGGFLAFRALRPIRALSAVTRSIVDTGRIDARVPDNHAGDELSDLGNLFNQMLTKIEVLISGMKEALDNVAHDLRTPVARLRGTAEEALRGDSGSHQAREALADCLEESDRVMTMLNTLMDISEAETGTMKLALESVSLEELIDKVMDLYEHVADEAKVRLVAHIPQDILLRADRTRLGQVVANLVDNAIKYTPCGGRVEINATKADGQATLVVCDTGVGIAIDDLPRIWDRLYRGDKSRSQRGLGLGLSLVKAVVQAHRGQIDASNNPAGGAVFTIKLPLASAH